MANDQFLSANSQNIKKIRSRQKTVNVIIFIVLLVLFTVVGYVYIYYKDTKSLPVKVPFIENQFEIEPKP